MNQKSIMKMNKYENDFKINIMSSFFNIFFHALISLFNSESFPIAFEIPLKRNIFFLKKWMRFFFFQFFLFFFNFFQLKFFFKKKKINELPAFIKN